MKKKFEHYSIPELNNVFTWLGEDSYEQVLKNAKPGEEAWQDLTAEKFREIVEKRVQ